MAPDLPPVYNTATLSHAQSLPLYTERPSPQELHVMNTFPTSSPDAANRPRSCIFKTDHLEIDLGEFPWALMYPAYGYNGVVEGVIKFSKKCTHVTQITVKLEGAIATTTSDYVNVTIPGVTRWCLVSRTVALLSPSDPEASTQVAAGSQYRFSLPFPTYVEGHNYPLPPSYTAIHPGAATEVRYHIEVSVSRKGFFRRREVRQIPVLYLPQTRPSVPAMLELPPLSLTDIPERVKAIELAMSWPDTCQAQQLTNMCIDLPKVHMFLPIPRRYASGDPIPIVVHISCPTSPAVTKLYTRNIVVQLFKRRKLYIGPNKHLNMRETLITTGTVTQQSDYEQGKSFVSFRLEAGVMGRESSWALPGVISVQYFVRVIVRPFEDVPHIPRFQHDEIVELTTDSYETEETQLLFGNISAPALGMTSLRPATTLTSHATTS